MEMYNLNNTELEDKVPDLYILSSGIEENKVALKLAQELRNEKYIVEKDICERSFKAQMKYANKLNCRYLIVIGGNEIEAKKVKIKEMATGEEKEINLTSEAIKEVISK